MSSYAEFHLTGAPYRTHNDITEFLNLGRPIPTESVVENPVSGIFLESFQVETPVSTCNYD